MYGDRHDDPADTFASQTLGGLREHRRAQAPVSLASTTPGSRRVAPKWRLNSLCPWRNRIIPPHYRRPADGAIPTPVRAVSFVLRAPPPTYLCIYGGEKLDMGGGGFPIDLVLFGMIAAFLVLRLRSILRAPDRVSAKRPPQPYQPPLARPHTDP